MLMQVLKTQLAKINKPKGYDYPDIITSYFAFYESGKLMIGGSHICT